MIETQKYKWVSTSDKNCSFTSLNYYNTDGIHQNSTSSSISHLL